MSVILHIETATDVCSVALGKEGHLVRELRAPNPREHISSLSVLIDELMEEANESGLLLSAIAVSSGPGSYTGLRVGYATAKGLCMALDIPLIEISTLDSLASGMDSQMNNNPDLFVPMIDARRMEVYAAFYDSELREVKPPHPWILDQKSLIHLLNKYDEVIFGGDGAYKVKQLLDELDQPFKNASIRSTLCNASFLLTPAWDKFVNGRFSDLAYSNPQYLKPANITTPKKPSL